MQTKMKNALNSVLEMYQSIDCRKFTTDAGKAASEYCPGESRCDSRYCIMCRESPISISHCSYRCEIVILKLLAEEIYDKILDQESKVFTVKVKGNPSVSPAGIACAVRSKIGGDISVEETKNN